jgi:hypothetical protein
MFVRFLVSLELVLCAAYCLEIGGGALLQKLFEAKFQRKEKWNAVTQKFGVSCDFDLCSVTQKFGVSCDFDLCSVTQKFGVSCDFDLCSSLCKRLLRILIAIISPSIAM